MAENTVVINEKLLRCIEFQQKNNPSCYTSNTQKEELVLEHVIQYKRQFELVYESQERELFLYPKNECGVYKFICSTIRPTKLGILQLYDARTAAQKLSEYIQYEELDPPYLYPSIIPSPDNVLKWQKGDCFDISIVLVSLLVGVGFDAYVVIGKAPKEITVKNEGKMEYKNSHKGLIKSEVFENDEFAELQKKNEFAIIKKDPVISKYIQKQMQEQEQEENERKRIAATIDDDEPDEVVPDVFHGSRVHAWVLLKKGKRGEKESIFLEPSTGRVYKLNESPYLYVDSVFNHQNFFINMNQELNVKDINFENMGQSGQDWEFVMLDIPTDDLAEDPENEDEHKEENDQQQNSKELGDLDMPPSWSPKLDIDQQQWSKGTPLGEQSTFYKKARVDIFGPYMQVDGLVERAIYYEDYKRIKVQEIRYFYYARSDKLVQKNRFPFEFKTIEFYEPGRASNWRQVIEIDRRLRIIHFYPNRNQDGLILREERFGEKTLEFYDQRDKDKIIYRSIRYSKQGEVSHKNYQFLDNNVGDVIITKMTQKTAYNPLLPYQQQISKMVVDFHKQQVTITFHLMKGQISPVVKVYSREYAYGINSKLNDQDKKQEDPLKNQEYMQVMAMEKECYQQIKQQETCAQQERNQLEEDQLPSNFKLEKTLHDKAREKYKQDMEKKYVDSDKDAIKDDYLYPFLKNAGCLDRLPTKFEAIEIKGQIMMKLRERLLSRADIIQKRLEAERQLLEQKEQQIIKSKKILQKDEQHMQNDEEKQLEEEMEQLKFKIEILDQRASRFEFMAFQKYEQIDKKLNEDKRLINLHAK